MNPTILSAFNLVMSSTAHIPQKFLDMGTDWFAFTIALSHENYGSCLRSDFPRWEVNKGILYW